MSTSKSHNKPGPGSKMVVRLWFIMMILVLFSIAFMWVVQIFLFEKNYVESTLTEVQGRLEPIMEDLKTEDLAYNDKLIPYLSKSVSGKMMLLNDKGQLLALYTNGHPVDLQVAETESMVWHNIKRSKEYQQALLGEQYKKIFRDDNRTVAFEIGIPVVYDGGHAYVILYHSLDEMSRVLGSNRQQLVVLSILLTLTAAVLAAVLSRYFIRPIQVINDTVNRLVQGQLDATPGLSQKDELGQLSDSVAQLGAALQRVDVLRKEVIANVSHELRSPLALIIGYGEMVRDISWSNEEERQDNMNLIINEARRMSEMVSDILDYSQFQAGYVHLKKDWYNLYDIVESEVSHCEQSAGEYDIAIALTSQLVEIPVLVDALKISQVMRNLLYNAINHAPGGSTIAVDIAPWEKGVRVSVANPGGPLSQEERTLIWERYQRSQHQGGRSQGTGLGLSIVSTILGAHQMPYGVDCADGRIIFWFCCPL